LRGGAVFPSLNVAARSKEGGGRREEGGGRRASYAACTGVCGFIELSLKFGTGEEEEEEEEERSYET